MGVVYADIELINESDVALAQRHMIGSDEIRRIRLNMLADSGAVRQRQRRKCGKLPSSFLVTGF